MDKYGEDRVFNSPLCEQVNMLFLKKLLIRNFRESPVSQLAQLLQALAPLLKSSLLIIFSPLLIRYFIKKMLKFSKL